MTGATTGVGHGREQRLVEVVTDPDGGRADLHGQAEDVLGVARDARRVAVLPARVDVVDVFPVPVARPASAAIDPGLFGHFADGSECVRRLVQRPAPFRSLAER